MPSGFDNPTLGEFLYMLSSMVLFMEDGGFYHDRHTATLSTDHIRNIGSKAEYASIAKGNAKTRCKALYSSVGFGDFGMIFYARLGDFLKKSSQINKARTCCSNNTILLAIYKDLIKHNLIMLKN